MRLTQHDVLSADAMAFIRANRVALEAALAPDLFDLGLSLASLEGETAKELLRRFVLAKSYCEKFLWVRLADHWVRQELSLEESIEWTNEDLLGLSERIETQVTEAYAGRAPRRRLSNEWSAAA